MARLIGPAQAERVFYYTGGSRKGQVVPNGTAVPLYADSQCSLPADVRSLDGGALAVDGAIPQVLISDTLEVPRFQFPDVEDPVVYTRVLGGPVFALHPDPDARLDAFSARITEVETTAGEAVDQVAGNLAAASAAAAVDATTKAAAATAAANAEAIRIAEIASSMRDRFPRNRGIAIGRRGTTIDLYQKMNDSVWWRSSLEAQTVPDTATPLHLMAAQALITPAAYVLAGGGTVTDSGSWTFGANVDALGGSYWQSTVAGATKTWTSPAGTTALGINSVTTTNGSLAKVSIDGDATRANLLPTAQSLVDAGTYANTILAANGGTLQPTDRVYYSFATAHSWSSSTMIATDLTPGAHTVVYTSLGYTPVGQGSANRAYISDFLYNNGQDLGAGSTTSVVEPVSSTISAISAWEYAILCRPTGSSQDYTIGNTHGGDTELSFQVYVNGAATTLTDNTITLLTDTAEIRRTSSLTHKYLNAGATKVADSEVWYRLTRDGIQVDNTITWTVGGLVTADFIMLPMPGVLSASGGQRFGRGDHSANGSGPLTFTGLNGVLDVPKSRSTAGWMWQASGRLAAGVWCANPAGYLLANSPTYFQDRNGDVLKLYIARSYAPNQSETVTAGQSRTGKARYCFRVATGIDALMKG
ncbi:hypothetical protein [Micromonospora orduensis]|uniref:hypothetical protein n=1 Tax=Micromonospora orduensis TaxID=1420891 RepID=UPI00340663AC